jgi:hypothetical protein
MDVGRPITESSSMREKARGSSHQVPRPATVVILWHKTSRPIDSTSHFKALRASADLCVSASKFRSSDVPLLKSSQWDAMFSGNRKTRTT